MKSKLQESGKLRVISLKPNICNDLTVIKAVAEMFNNRRGGYVCFSTVHMVMEAYDDPKFGDVVNSADLIVTDGMPIVWVQKLQGASESSRVRANDLMMLLCKYAESEGIAVGFYGGKQEVIDAIKRRAANDFQDLNVAYAFSPPFRPLNEQEDAEITAEINDSGVRILFVGLGCPKQERWMADHKSKLNCVLLGVEASFDFFAGNIKECPNWIGRFGLEWLFRLTQEPKRLWRRYLILNPRFVFLALLQLTGIRKFD